MKKETVFSSFLLSAFVLIAFALPQISSQVQGDAELLYTFNYLNFTWENETLYQQWAALEGWEDCMLAGIKVSSNGDIYVSVPRWKPNVPATLNKLVTVDNMVLLQPFPSWEMNEVGNPAALQSVLGFEIDSQDRIWILDQGKVNGEAAIPGSIKLVLWDLNSNSHVWTYTFPEDQASLDGSFMNDVVVDETNNFAYITDSGININSSIPTNGSLFAFNVATTTSQRILSEYWSVNANESLWITINGNKVLNTRAMMTGADGIALHPNDTTLYWCALTSWEYHAIDTSLLRNFSVSDDQRNASTVTHWKGFASDGLGMDNVGRIYFTSLEYSGLFHDDTTALTAAPTAVATDSKQMIWPDTMAFDNNGSILYVTNHLMFFMEDALNYTANATQNSPQSKTASNYCIWKVNVGANSYLDPTKYAPVINGPQKPPRVLKIIVLAIGGAAVLVVIVSCIWNFIILPFTRRSHTPY